MSGRGKVRVGVLEAGSPPGGLAARFGSYPSMFERLLGGEGAFEFTAFDVRSGALPTAPEACAAYVVTGSAYGVYDPEPWIGQLRDFLAASRGRAALVGVCFGHQIMAEAFGGKVIRSPKGWGIGLHAYQARAEEPWMEPVAAFSAPASHQDQVVVTPPGARVIAASGFSPNGMLAYDDQPAISIQLHPEFDPAYAKALIEARRGSLYAEGQAERAIASLDDPNDCARIGGWIGAFLRRRTAA
ncbi:MAG: type 1 glutamine amidotransferase [Caulobacteraceae bacterium]|nr:type 1 glutamine amidotransferase [Caulobacteraceae bacterium]